MSPVARRQGGAHTGRAVLVAVVGVTIALGVAFGVATLAGRGDVEVRLGDDRFDAGGAQSRADSVDAGGPVLFPDVANFQRAIYVDHTGDDPATGWVAVGAFEPDDPTCVVTFDTVVELYVSACDESTTFPRSGAGLRQFPTEVVEGRLFVNLQDTDQPPE